jgi:hypothetical protein
MNCGKSLLITLVGKISTAVIGMIVINLPVRLPQDLT